MSASRFIGKLDLGFNPFTEDYLSEILQAVAVAWSRMKHPSRTEIEDRITFRLAGRLQMDTLFMDLPYDIVPQYWLLGVNGERVGRLDLRFKHRFSQRDYFALEAKRLHVFYPGGTFKAEYATYAGEDGMMAFVEGQYCHGFPAGGMLAYVMDGDTGVAWVGLDQRIESQRTPLRLTNASKLAKSPLASSVLQGITGTYLGETRHDLGRRSLRLFHLLLPVHAVAPSVDAKKRKNNRQKRPLASC